MSGEPLDRVPLGERVTVRHRLPDGRATDSVGTLAARDAASVTLRTRAGEVRVPLSRVVVHRVVRPRPWRVAAFLRRAGVAVISLDGAPSAGTVALLSDLATELVEAGVQVVVLGNGTDDGRKEVGQPGVGLVPWRVDLADLGCAAPGAEAYAAVHAWIEERLGGRVAREDVRFTDDRPANVDAARRFGWQARIFTRPQ